jgi:hypothetical protein
VIKNAEFQIRVVDVRLSVAHFIPSAPALSLKASMAPVTNDSDSNATDVESSPRKSKSQAQSPERHDQSDQPGPADSEEEDSEVYEIERILDAKRGATGSVGLTNP